MEYLAIVGALWALWVLGAAGLLACALLSKHAAFRVMFGGLMLRLWVLFVLPAVAVVSLVFLVGAD